MPGDEVCWEQITVSLNVQDISTLPRRARASVMSHCSPFPFWKINEKRLTAIDCIVRATPVALHWQCFIVERWWRYRGVKLYSASQCDYDSLHSALGGIVQNWRLVYGF